MNKKKIAGAILEVASAVIATTSNMYGTVCDIQEIDTPTCRVAEEINHADDASTVLAGLSQNKKQKTNSKTMANNNVLDGQIELLEHLKTKLTDFIDQLDELKSEYEKTVNDLEISGLENTFLERFVDELDEMKTNVNKIVDDIEGEDIPYIDTVIDYLTNPPV